MRNKKIIMLICVIAIVVIAFIALSSVFAVANVTLAFYDQEGRAIAYPEGDNVPDVQHLLGQYKGKSVFTLDKQSVIDNINELYNSYHALAVVKEFPNSITIHIVEREEVYCINNGAKDIYLDSFGYVLNSRINDTRTLMNISHVFVSSISNSEVGSKLQFSTDKDNQRLDLVIGTVNTIWTLKYSYNDVPLLINSIQFDKDNNIMTIVTTTNTLIKVITPQENLSQRLVKAFSVYNNPQLDLRGKTIFVPLKGNITTTD